MAPLVSSIAQPRSSSSTSRQRQLNHRDESPPASVTPSWQGDGRDGRRQKSKGQDHRAPPHQNVPETRSSSSRDPRYALDTRGRAQMSRWDIVRADGVPVATMTSNKVNAMNDDFFGDHQ